MHFPQRKPIFQRKNAFDCQWFGFISDGFGLLKDLSRSLIAETLA
jgi:hypothetical protein